MKNLPLFFGILFGTLALVTLVAVVFTKQANAPIDLQRVVGNERNVTGSETPKVTIVEFSDLQCPACRSAQPLVKSLLETYPEDVKVIYRHFPLVNIHPNAMAAANATEVAASLGKFWEYHDLLFLNQAEWSDLSSEELTKKFGEYAVQLEIPQELMEQGIKDMTFSSLVAEDVTDGTALGISSTPTFYVNGEKVLLQNLQSTVANLVKE